MDLYLEGLVNGQQGFDSLACVAVDRVGLKIRLAYRAATQPNTGGTPDLALNADELARTRKARRRNISRTARCSLG